jgi:hypothetical protein
MERKAYPSDISDEEWALVAPTLAGLHYVALVILMLKNVVEILT